MSASAVPLPAVPPEAADRARGPRSGTVLALCSMSLVQLGAALSPPLFDRAGVSGVTWLRLLAGAAILLAFARPRLRGRSRRDLWGAVALGVASAAMTIFFMLAIDRIPLGV